MTTVPHTTEPTAAEVVLTGVLALSVAMGIGRFAFTPVLPLMLRDGWLDLSGGGWMAMSNYLGYFLGALSCMVIRQAPTTMIRWGLVCTVVLTALMALVHPLALAADGGAGQRWAYGVELVLRLGSGIASAWTFVFASGWGLQTLSKLNSARLSSLIFCGPGLGIVLSGLLIAVCAPFGLNASMAWGLLAVLALGLSLYIARHLSPITAPAHAAPLSANRVRPTQGLRVEATIFTFAYGLAGFGYIITATFLPVLARQALPHAALNDFFWPMFGASIAVGAWQAGRVPMTVDPRYLLVVCYIMQAVGVWISLLLPNAWGFTFACILLGLPYTALVLFAMREAARMAHLMDVPASKMMGLMTAIYGLGQIIGPPLATTWAKAAGSFTPSLVFAGASLLLGAVIFFCLGITFPPARH